MAEMTISIVIEVSLPATSLPKLLQIVMTSHCMLYNVTVQSMLEAVEQTGRGS